ncbi:MAG: Sua5/YciO/YrdC/YwlC family protein, partial [Ignavibacteria bacterium]|nr:Sua5/YciO/YrdC/YwlC family protein [Ignavibacteria bacterium]
MEYYELHPINPQLRFINKAVEVLKEGGVIIYPTDTVYGIGCDIFNRDALDRVYQ